MRGKARIYGFWREIHLESAFSSANGARLCNEKRHTVDDVPYGDLQAKSEHVNVLHLFEVKL